MDETWVCYPSEYRLELNWTWKCMVDEELSLIVCREMLSQLASHFGTGINSI